MRQVARCAAALALLAVGTGGTQPQHAWAQVAAVQPPLPATAAAVPWSTGEYLEYAVKFGFLRAGTGRMQVIGLDTLRGRTVWRLRFNVTGGVPFVRINDTYDSWMDVETLNSLRFVQDLNEAGYHPRRRYEIFPERGMYSLNGKEEQPSVENPLDDAAFFFFLRSIPLEAGKTYEFHRYFEAKSNPVIIKVLYRDTVEVEAGRFAAVVIQPIIKSGGTLFSEGSHAEIWLSDDNRRILLQMKTQLNISSLNLYLKIYKGTQPIAPPPVKPK